MFRRIVIVNRGEAAMRLIHAVRDLNAERLGADPITTIALYTDGEKAAMFVREADEAYPIGPASARPYLDHELLMRVLTEARADAVWVGWGFVAEDAGFAERVTAAGITFIGPSADAMRKLGDKIGSKLLAEQVGVPVAPWSGGGLDSLDDALAAAERVGYPLMLKATAGGGGRGIRRVDSADDLTDAYQRTRDEAQRAFGSGVVFLEKLVTGARHVEVQVIADAHGTAWALGVRDCTVQRRNQKVIEESASPLLSADQTAHLRASAERLALAVDYVGAATVEFLYHPADKLFAFLEVNTRLQVEHPITEVTNDFDLVKAQLHVAAGGRLGERPVEQGHAVEARLNAEDPDRDFAPSAGLITRFDVPVGPGVRVDTGVGEGDTIPADFDSMIAKVIASGRTRTEALGRLRRALAETTVIIEGGATNKSFVLDLLSRAEVVGPDADGVGEQVWADTGWIDRVRADGGLVADRYSGVALVGAAIKALGEVERREIAHLLETAHGGRPQVQHKVGLAVEQKLRGATYTLVVFRTGPDRYRVRFGDDVVDAELTRLDDAHGRLRIGGEQFRIVTANHGPVQFIEVNGVAHRVSRDEGGVLRSPAPALVVATPVAVGDEVAAGAPVVVLESMKMETVIAAPFAARVKELMVISGSQVESLAPLVRLEPLSDATDEVAEAGEIDLPQATSDPSAQERAARRLDELSAHLKGYDTDPAAGVLPAYLAARDAARAEGVDVLSGEIGLVTLFADLAELSRNRPADEHHSELRIHSDRELFHRYLQSLDSSRAALPSRFVDRLTCALAHYDVTDLDRTPGLDEAVFRIFLAQQRVAGDVQVVLAILDRWIGETAPDEALAASARAQLERLVRATQRRFPAVSDVARSVRFRWFDQPQVDAEREKVLARVATEVADLAAHPDAADYAERVAALAIVPERMSPTLAARLVDGVCAHEPLLEILLRKHYRDYELTDVRAFSVAGRSVVVADCVIGDRQLRVITANAVAAELDVDGPVAAMVADQVRSRPQGAEAVVELYVGWPSASDQDRAIGLREQVRGWELAGVRRVTIAACSAEGDVDYITFRPDAAGEPVEDERIRGVHPMVFRRLNLWRLSEFDATRLPAPRGVLLFDCVAKSNPDDRRLVAMAEVSQLAAVR
ncbi:MAG: ATP-grasp domain-containing protein, partial [Actinobacteria bacterium]|nr:ATP-grasp domain-containing protein [Actinomycetota bacterium]MBU4207446.1 ATP-grasp domain-containing protein [Actinomycetota bacterium]MBU4410515.1 ATP-grasp domain-containing protein [Actinomycetota bacterium]